VIFTVKFTQNTHQTWFFEMRSSFKLDKVLVYKSLKLGFLLFSVKINSMIKNELYPLFFTPTIKNYIWGGRTFEKFLVGDQSQSEPIAEIWTIYDQNIIKNGSLAGSSLKDVVRNFKGDLIGSSYTSDNYENFPLLIKLLDCQEWLSIQVHPNDIQSIQFEGIGFSGKSEGWVVLDANPNAQLIAGVVPDTDHHQLSDAIKNGTIISVIQSHDIKKDDFILIPAGTIHALGPGSIVYEIQQNSDVTYRVYDWDRPASAGRPLHIEKSIAVSDPTIQVELKTFTEEQFQHVFSCQYFSLDRISSNGEKAAFSTQGKSFHTLTVTEGNAVFESRQGSFGFNQYESVLVPACCNDYQLKGDFKLLKGSLNIN
jgi:mannose-6-phosphate isomerase